MGEGSGFVDGSLETSLQQLIKSMICKTQNIFVRELCSRGKRKLKIAAAEIIQNWYV